MITASCALALGLTALAGAASAQTPDATAEPNVGQARTLTPATQYITWAGRGPAVMPEAVRTADATTPRRRSNAVIPHGGFASAVPMPQPEAPARAQPRTLTPASAWTAPRPAPAPAPEPIPAPAAETAASPTHVGSVDLPPPPRAAPYQPRIQPGPQPQRQAQPLLPDYVAGQGGQPAPSQAVYAEAAPTPVPAPVPAPVYEEPPAQPPADYDPMAPRRDAPIFRLQRPAPQPAAESATAPPAAAQAAPASAPVAEAPAPRLIAAVAANPADHPSLQGSRRYSVHRQNGQQPDAVPLPAPTYVDALAVTLTETPASQDLAEPAPGPNLYRDAQGRIRAAPAASDGDHQ